MAALVGHRDQSSTPDLDLTRADNRLAGEQRRVAVGDLRRVLDQAEARVPGG
jgi:hypothetical protein